MHNFRFILFFIFSLSASQILADSHEHEHEHEHDENNLFEEHGTHVHGHAVAQISYVDNILNISKTLPSIDVFGFEHTPKNDEQNNKIMQSIATLENTENIFSFENKACELESVHIENGLAKPDVHSHHDHEDHRNDADNNNNEKSHTNIVANYIFNCDSKKLETIEYLIFDHFPTLEEIEVQFISDHHQALFNATHSNRIQKLH